MKGAPIWVLTDDRPGNVAQCLGVAEALGEDFIVKPIAYNRWAALPNALRGRSLLGLTPECRASLQPPWPRLVIAAGRRTAPLARWCKRQLGTRLVQIMDPGWPGRDDFDLIARPLHDGPILRPNVLQTLGSCHRVTPALLASEKEKWASRLPDLPRPWVALLVGGATKEHPFGLDLGEQLVAGTVALARQLGASILVTTSRRTGPALERLILDSLPQPRFVHCWRPDSDNPYMALLAMADGVVATGDSMNMCSEACATAAPVYIFAPPGMVNAKHARLHALLYEQGFARPLGGDAAPWRHASLNAALDVAQEIRARGLNRL